MAKKTAFVPKEPIAKLPLAVRKDVRDNYENEKEEWETKVAELVGIDKFTFNFNPNAVWAYAEEGQTNAGKVLADYAKGFIHGLTAFIETYEEEGKKDFAKAVSAAEVQLDAHPLGDDAPEVINAEIRNGVWTILFRNKCLGYNVASHGATEFCATIDAARTEGFSLKAKKNIDEYYTDKIDDLKEQIGKLLNMEDVILDPNFEENYATLKKKKDDEWQGRFGKTTYEYFEGLQRELDSNNFGSDDMLQEGFAEAVPSKTVKIRIVDKTKSGNLNEPVLEDDTLYLQTTLDGWYYNTSRIADGLVQLM